MTDQLIRSACRELMTTSDLVYVSSIDENGYPQIRAMGNLCNREQYSRLTGFFEQQDEFTVFLTTNRPSDKINQIAKNPKVCVYYADFKEIHGLMIGGMIEIIEDREIRHILWEDNWIQFYFDGVDGTDYTVLKVVPKFVKGWYKNAGKFEYTINA